MRSISSDGFRGRPSGDADAAEAQTIAAAVDKLDQLGLPRGVRAALAHSLHAAALELSNGRPLPLEVRRAARHLVQEIHHAARGADR